MPRIYSRKTKQKVCRLRGRGWSLGEISLKTRIPKSTILGWVRDICLNEKQKGRIKQKIIASGAIGRPLAVKANREKIEKWKEGIRNKVKYFEELPLQNPKIGKLICGILYLCEGAKYPSSRYLYFGNSDPKMVCFFLRSLRRYYHIDENKLRFGIGYRYDQNYQKLKTFWSKLTKIPKSKFLKSQPDIRTRCKPTLRKKYYGVGRLIYYDTTLQFELQSIGETIIKNGAGGT
ncbi:MAG: hypothetical protein WCL25_02915 [bacterium]